MNLFGLHLWFEKRENDEEREVGIWVDISGSGIDRRVIRLRLE